jgi:hypothetical protein
MRYRLVTYLVLALVCGLALAIGSLQSFAQVQNYTGPLRPHVGLEVTTSFDNASGPDSELHSRFTAVTSSTLSIDYSSSRGMRAKRNITIADRQSSRTYVIG